MTNGAQDYNIATIRQLLLAAFTPEEFRRFCYDRPTFRPVVKRFGRPYRLDDMVDEVVEYCDRHLLLDQLLAELKKVNPGQYTRFFGSQLSGVEVEEPEDVHPPPPTPEPALSASETDTLTITHPRLEKDEKPREQAPAEVTLEIPTVLAPVPLHLIRVPAGESVMGSVLTRERQIGEDELPPRRVYLPEFHIGKYPVTNLQYQAFVQATKHRVPQHWEGLGLIPFDEENRPVTGVSWLDAVAFCTWLAQETKEPVRLPTEAEWEKAARGTDSRIYPWGDEPPDEDKCNFANNLRRTTPIGRYSPQGDSPYGCADMAGNVWEWCQSLYRPYPYQADDGREAMEEKGRRVRRGGSFRDDERSVRCAGRSWGGPEAQAKDAGFRVVVASGPFGP